MGEVVQRHERLHAPRPAALEDRGVALEGAVVDLARCRLDPRPLDAEAEGVAAERGGAVECSSWRFQKSTARPDGSTRPGPLPPDPVVGGLARAR